MSRKTREGSRNQRRANTKSALRKHCQNKTRNAARKAAKTLQGKSRVVVGGRCGDPFCSFC